MPEISEIKISSDFINYHSKDNVYTKIFTVEKGNEATQYLDSEFLLKSESNGKELIINIIKDNIIPIYVFMGMSGNWSYVKTKKWNETKYIRLRFDDNRGMSLILHGGYMGPKYKIGYKFTGVKRGVDLTKNFNDFKYNIISNLDKKDFKKSICEVLLNQKYFNGIGAYLTSEIVGRTNLNPYRPFNSLNEHGLNLLLNTALKCCNETYEHGGGELKDWKNPFGSNRIDEWIKFYGNKEICKKAKFGNRNIWIKKDFSI